MKTAWTSVLLTLALAVGLAASLAGGPLFGPVAALAAAPAAPSLAVPAGAASIMTWDGQRDVGALMAEARQTWNLADQDAVILLDEARMTYAEDGRLRQERHRVVWIFTDWAVDNFADLRVPWDSERQKLTVQALRVWRDGHWIAARPTAVVETTPFALRSAPDYTGIRETMLLHDGVELPCVLECDYVIEDTQAPDGWTGWEDGQWIFPQAVPVVESRLILESPAGKPLQLCAVDGCVASLTAEPSACEPTTAASGAGLAARCYEMRKLAPSPLPAIDDPASMLPHVQWSTFADWDAFGQAINAEFRSGLDLGPALKDSVQTLLAGALGVREKARRIEAFLHRSMRRIDYDGRFFPARLRPVDRVFDTAYGADLDLARLAAALFQEIGCKAYLEFWSHGNGEIDEGVPTLARMRPRALSLFLMDDNERLDADWEIEPGRLDFSQTSFLGHTVWRLPQLGIGNPELVQLMTMRGSDWRPSFCKVACDLRWDADKKSWLGEGWLAADAVFCPERLVGSEISGIRKHLNGVVGRFATGLAVQDFSSSGPSIEHVEWRFDLQPSAAKRDSLGRLPVVIGSPAGGLRDVLPHDVDVSQAERGSPVRLPGPLVETVRVTLALGGLEVVRLPEPVKLANDAGSYELAVERQGHKVTIIRTIRLTQIDVAPEQWPALRELLLAEADAGNRTVLLR